MPACVQWFLSIILETIAQYYLPQNGVPLNWFRWHSMIITHSHPPFPRFQYFPENCKLFNAECISFLDRRFCVIQNVCVCAHTIGIGIGLEIPQNIWIHNLNGCDFQVDRMAYSSQSVLISKLCELLKTIGSSYYTALDNSIWSKHSMFFHFWIVSFQNANANAIAWQRSKQCMFLHLEPIWFTIAKFT